MDINKRIKTISETFEGQVQAVYKLSTFDRGILDLVIDWIEDLSERLRNSQKIDNPELNGEKLITMIRGVRTNDALRPRYKTIFNQSIVLLVSYFASALGDLFNDAVTAKLIIKIPDKVKSEEIKLTLTELDQYNFNISKDIGRIISRKNDISFQDMQSIGRAFTKYLGIEIKRDNVVNNIIVGQACRHVIVHSGERVDERLVKQVSGAQPRDLKTDVKSGDRVEFTPDEIEIIGDSMIEYLSRISSLLLGPVDLSWGNFI